MYCGQAEASDSLRYGPPGGLRAGEHRPVVVWNCTRRCNLRCGHCYSASDDQPSPDELTGAEARAMLDDLGGAGCPAVLFSGGEPLLRENILELTAHASSAGMRTVLSTNGTLIDAALAGELAAAGVDYVGVSLDGIGESNDKFRGENGAFDKALAGIRHCKEAGVKVGLRFTMHSGNASEIDGIFDLLGQENIPRVCFYHLVETGRGRSLRDQALSHAQTRAALDLIMDHTAAMHASGVRIESLTVDNHADGPYVYLRLLREAPARAETCIDLLRRNGGNASGSRIACIRWNGDVLPDQFWSQQVLGNVRRRPFSEIWRGGDEGSLLAQLRDRKRLIKGRCRQCRFLDTCNGNLRARAQAATGDIWGEDPACYLSNEEIAP